MQFAEVDGLRIAWEQYGEGPDCVVVPPFVSNIELQWEHEYYRRVMEFLGSHLRVTHLDKRGMGLSDRTVDAPDLTARARDITAVMDAAGLERAHVLGVSEGGLMAQLFAAKHPERVDRLVLANALPHALDPPAEFATRAVEAWPEILENWGRDGRANVEWWSPSNADNASFVRWWARFQRQAATRADVERQLASLGLIDDPDLGDFLAEIRAPTLVVNCAGDTVLPAASGDTLAARIEGATRQTFDSDDHFYFLGDHWLEATRAIVEFMTGDVIAPPTERRFMAVVFTDIVGSTARLAEVGDAAWAAALDSHDRLAWELADRLDLTIVKSTGDGLLAMANRPGDAVSFCSRLADALAPIGLEIRAGVHAGEIEIRPNGDITGIAVNLAARVEQAAGDGEVLVSAAVREALLGGGHRFEDRGEHVLKGIAEPRRLFALVP